MSDSHLPDDTEPGSSWQKAVSDVISHSIKVEKKLENALKSQRKVNKNLEMIRFPMLRNELDKFMSSPQESEPSDSGSESTEDDEPLRNKYMKDRRTEEKKAKTPDRPLLGNGSLEKMKKSQNSFNVEPMGSDDMNEDDDADFTCEDNDNLPLSNLALGERKIQYLHFKDDSDFERSDSDSSIAPEAPQETNPIQKLQNIPEISSESPATKPADPQKKVPELIMHTKTNQNSDLDTRLHLALAKRDILNENLKAMSIGNSCHTIQVKRSVIRVAAKKGKAQQVLTPFINFYLEVYRELCHKCSENQISEEAARRWWTLSPKQRASYAKLRRRK